MEESVGIGVIGIGNMGTAHAMNIYQNKVKGLKLVAVCDVDQERLVWAKENLEMDVEIYKDYHELLGSDTVDAVLVATPHPSHPFIVEAACKLGKHVITEKPAGIDVKTVNHMNEVAKKSNVVFGIMYNQRTNPLYAQLRQYYQSGALGRLIHFNWIISNWYRTDAYYASGSWRATWDGEGGGVLMNQCPHNLDIWQWITGMPVRVKAFCHQGKFHPIAVEDAAEIYVEYENGAIGYFQTSTGEYPGTNRLELSASKGKAVIENGKLTIQLLKQDLHQFTEESEEYMPALEVEEKVFIQKQPESAHIGILQNFTDAILKNEPLIAPGEEGIMGLSIANAAYLSSWTGDFVELPLDENKYFEWLCRKQNCQHSKNLNKKSPSIIGDEYSERWKVKW